MTQYSNPELTQREMVESSKEAVIAALTEIDTNVAAVQDILSASLDYLSVQVLKQHINMLNNTKYQLNNELSRLTNIIAVWNGEETTEANTFTPTLPTNPA